jgi:hypothetical protein
VRAVRKAKERNLVDELLDPFRLLAAQGKAPKDVSAALSLFKVRPWYSAVELAYIWPLVSIGLAAKDNAWRPSPERLAARLLDVGLPRVRTWSGDYTFTWQGREQEFFIVQDVARLQRLRFTQADFERVMI